jgi:hypothetical protein
MLTDVPWFVYIIALCCPLVFIPVQEGVKMHDKRVFARMQKRAKLEFNTKLGQYSPV